MKILVAGSRDYTNQTKIYKILSKLPTDTIIIHGDCRGADRIAGFVATQLGMIVCKYPADWKQYGRAAGPIRNQQMLNENEDIEKAIIFHECIDQSTGTKDMLSRLKRKGIPVEIYT